MKNTILVSLLILCALLIGLFLPTGVIRLQELDAHQVEGAEITTINLSIGSGLTHMEKLAILSSPDCTVMNVGVGKHQTPSTLSQHSWHLLERIMSNGVLLLDAGTTQQTEQFALMASLNNQPFIFWEVIFSDAAGNHLRFHLDDETGLPLAMSYTSSHVGTDLMTEWCATSLFSAHELCDIDAEIPNYENQKHTTYELPITDGTTTCSLHIEIGDNWFVVGNQIG